MGDMRTHFPPKVILTEVGMRDGLQLETQTMPTRMKVQVIQGLIDAGLTSIQVTAFVHPHKVPQMADADELMRRLPKTPGVVFNALVLNVKGVERALAAGLQSLEISISASETHSLKNAGMGVKRAEAQSREMIRLAKASGVPVRGGIQCAFGCAYEGVVPLENIMGLVEGFMAQGVDALSLADTTGMADPVSIGDRLEKILPMTRGTDLGLHFHDTRGLGLVNVMTAMGYGIDRFDVSLAGMGGCPFVKNAAGNVATEDVAHLMHCLKIETGIDIGKVAACSARLETFFGKRFPGRMHRLMV